jgi:hypothetical protein
LLFLEGLVNRFGTLVRHAVRRGRPVLSKSMAPGRRSAALGALLLLGSAVSTLATGNSAPEIISASLSQSVIDEGDTVTVTGTFTDADAGDRHTVWITWRDGALQYVKLELPPGQTTFQATHTYRNNRPSGAKVGVWLKDHQLPPGANDNSEGEGEDYLSLPITVKNVAPTFEHASIQVTKAGGKSGAVVVEGSLTDPGNADALSVVAGWGENGVVSPKPASACTVNQHARTFRCEHTYSPTKAQTYPISLVVRDPDGGEGTAKATVQFP